MQCQSFWIEVELNRIILFAQFTAQQLEPNHYQACATALATARALHSMDAQVRGDARPLGEAMLKLARNNMFIVIAALVATPVFVFMRMSAHDSSAIAPHICGVDQIKVAFEGEDTLANVLALNEPNAAVGKVAKMMNLDPTATIQASDDGVTCIPVGVKLARQHSSTNAQGTSEKDATAKSKSKGDTASQGN